MQKNMARTQAKDYGIRRRVILDKAAELFADRGYARSSISEIAKACDASKSSLYHYYPSKESILFDIMMLHVTELLEAAENARKNTNNPKENLKKLVRNLMSIYINAGSKHIIILHDIGCLPKEEQITIRRIQEKIILIAESILSEIIPDLAEDSNLKKPMTMAFLGMINWTHTWFKKDGAMTIDQFADLSVSIFLNGALEQKQR
jgi:AcrR family transcriptional regulator